MASSRLEKIGNIFTRVQGLLKSGAMKHEDRPIFYDIYKAFPPLKEPKYREPTDESIKIREIFYAEDLERANRDDSASLFNLNERTKGEGRSVTEQLKHEQEWQRLKDASNPDKKPQKVFNIDIKSLAD